MIKSSYIFNILKPFSKGLYLYDQNVKPKDDKGVTQTIYQREAHMDNNESTAGFDEKDTLLTDVDLDSMPKASVDALNEILLNTQEQCQMVSQLIENQIQVKDQMIDRLHSDLSYYRQESADRFIEQLTKSVIKIRKDMKRRMASAY